MDRNSPLALFLVFAPLSVLSFGGGQTLVPEFQHQTVVVHHWLSGSAFADIYGLARAAPGPSTLIVALIGWQVSGFWGALTAAIAIFMPSSLIVYGVAVWWRKHRGSHLQRKIKVALMPIAAGMVIATPVVLGRSAQANLLQLATAAVAFAIFTFTSVSNLTVAAATGSLYAMLYFLFPGLVS
jgi:chromate transporter